MTDHATHAEHEHEHAHDDAHALGHDNSPEAIRKEVRKYLIVLGCLGALTLITVWISYFHLPTWQAVTIALIVASIKASLVAAFFMHLISERKLIYAVLAITVFFFSVMLWGPSHHHSNAESQWPGYDANSKAAPAAPEHEAEHH
jgi:cytochrome c oxidase subunit 4